jgi:hypothetical protein
LHSAPGPTQFAERGDQFQTRGFGFEAHHALAQFTGLAA